MRIVGLLVFLWENKFFKQLRDAFEGFMIVDKDSAKKPNLQ